MTKLVYFDNSATTKPFEEVACIMQESLQNGYFNPSSAYKQAIGVSKQVEESRLTISRAIGCEKEELFFTSGGTESINTAINCASKLSKKRHIITSVVEHDATLKTMEHMEKEGYKVTYLRPNINGLITFNQVLDAVGEDTFLVSLMRVNNELGSITDICKIGNELHSLGKGILFHVDAIQGFLKQQINVKKSKIHMLSLSGHKVNGPKGIGALYVSKDIRLEPLIFGGGQEAGKRSGTENVAGILGFGEAVRLNYEAFEKNIALYKILNENLMTTLQEKLTDFKINSPKGASDNIVNISFLGVRAEVLLNSLAARDILVSSGSACSSKKKASHVLTGVGLSNERIDSAIRISFGSTNTVEEVKLLVDALQLEVEDIRRFTKYKKGR